MYEINKTARRCFLPKVSGTRDETDFSMSGFSLCRHTTFEGSSSVTDVPPEVAEPPPAPAEPKKEQIEHFPSFPTANTTLPVPGRSRQTSSTPFETPKVTEPFLVRRLQLNDPSFDLETTSWWHTDRFVMAREGFVFSVRIPNVIGVFLDKLFSSAASKLFFHPDAFSRMRSFA